MSSQKQWAEPAQSISEDGLRLYNSLLDDKTVFVPRGGPGSKNVYWYCCGPTVYDSAHIGHARNYVTFDIIRRVLEDHFGYNVTYVMNVTDVDDKIITRARRNHLVAEFLKNDANLEKVIILCSDAIAQIVPGQEAKVKAAQQKLDQATSTDDSKAIKEYQERLDGDKLKLSKVQEDAKRVQELKTGAANYSTPQAIAKDFQDIVGEYLDGLHGSTVTDIQIYRAHAAYFEKQFFDDLDALNCRMPHAIPRITDHIPEIVAFIEKIMGNGFAYAAGREGNKSVYFDTSAFRAAGHRYGKLEPWKVGSADLASEGESNFRTTEKRGAQDFVLWKASKTGEPSWESPWGPGRPGWHIECSAMVDSVCGTQIDIHSGGSDLRFPHHDNEIAQSEAYNCGCNIPTKFDEQWCNYWLHSGHLEIDGLKMSKSLKNFITIREALQEFSARQLRLLFCLSSWSQPIKFTQQSRGEMVQKEATLKNFFLSVQVVLRTNALEKSSTRALPEHQAIAAATAECQDAVNKAFMDNIDTVTVMDKILGLVNKVNTYIDRVCPAAAIQPDALRVRQAAEYITRVLRILGLSDAGPDDLGFTTRSTGGATDQTAAACAVAGVFAAFASTLQALPHLSDVPGDARARIDRALSGAPQQQSGSGVGAPGVLEGFLKGKSADAVVDELVACRDVVRAAARDAGAVKRDIMRICDEVRDISLVEIGIKLEDKPGGGVWMRVDAAELRKEMEEKRKAAAMAALDKAEKKLSMTKEELSKAEAVLKFATTQEALATKFRFNAENTVTHENKDGEWLEVDAKRLKAIGKIIEKEEKVRAPVTKKVAQNANYLADTQAKIAELEQQVQQLSATGL